MQTAFGLFDFFSVTFGAGGSTRDRTSETVIDIQEKSGIEVAPHLSCISSTQDNIHEILQAYMNKGINHIVARTQLFLDLELMDVGQSGFWSEINDESYQPTPSYWLSRRALRTYGELPRGLLYSHGLRCALQFPLDPSASYAPASASPTADGSVGETSESEEPAREDVSAPSQEH